MFNCKYTFSLILSTALLRRSDYSYFLNERMEVDWLEARPSPSAQPGLDPTPLTSVISPRLDSGPVTNNDTQFGF